MMKTAILGGGKIGEALLAGLIGGGQQANTIHVTNRDSDRGRELTETYGITHFTDNAAAVADMDVVFVCVKPADTVRVLQEVSATLDTNDSDTLVVSMAAGIPIAALEDVVSAGTPIVRVMPNTPMLIGHGMSAVARGRFVSDDQLDKITELLETVGDVAVVEESKMDAVTAMSGSSPAYLFLVAEAMVDAGVNLGLDRQLAGELVISTLEGAAAMMKESDQEPVELKNDVCSPGGTTIAAVRALEEAGIRAALFRATQACAHRSAELGAQLAPPR
ncbi:pyrroline-5-carboxylate reductase [Corynebacterium mendelii]|uniref:Pyrroline-5-carboxylate reductase n=1 Tax=Corynebacterium mendelii TaxID=2765362 RepID=A0A939DZV7_9CORY|nr:pyrroline-5-carboxylate reductase [Corynebacterium mendelii]MBN9643874.1 pyrroline-5-carboxylate reductase [Corynebacterium mendelii]